MGDDQGLFGAPWSQTDSQASYETPDKRRQGSSERSAEKRRCLRRGDYAAVMMIKPHAPSSIEAASAEELWGVVSAGSDYTPYHCYAADKDPSKRGIAISQFAQCLKYAIKHFREDRVKAILDPGVYEKVKNVVDGLYVHLEVLDGGAGYGSAKPAGFSSLGRAMPVKQKESVHESAKAVYAWLGQASCPFRAYLTIMSGSMIVAAAQVEEKLFRGFRAIASVDEFVAAAECRLCSSVGARAAAVAIVFHEAVG